MSRNKIEPIYLAYVNKMINGFDDESNIIEFLESYHGKNEFEIYDLSSNLDTENEQENIIKIKKDRINRILFITNNKNLFINFNRPIQLVENKKIYSINELKNQSYYIDNKSYNLIENFKYGKIHMIEELISYIDIMFNKYGEIFQIDIKLLIKETTYLANDKNKLRELINEDIDMLEYKHILTSRLSIILYRLIFFDLNATATAIGNFYREQLNVKSKSYKFNYLNNTYDFYFPTLANKSFRGYEIPLPKEIQFFPNFFREKIKMAKVLLRNKVNIKIVSEAIEIEIDEIEKIIYDKQHKKQSESKSSTQSEVYHRGSARNLRKIK